MANRNAALRTRGNDVRVLFSMDSIPSLRVSFLFELFVPFLFGFISSQSSVVNHLVRYTLSLIYKGIRLYARVTNLRPEGKQTGVRDIFWVGREGEVDSRAILGR